MFEFACSGRRALRLASVLSRWLSLRGRCFYHLLVGYHVNRTKYFALTILSIVCWFRGMVVKACFQINTEAIGLD